MRYTSQVILEACCVASALASNKFRSTRGGRDLAEVAASLDVSTDAVELFSAAWIFAQAAGLNVKSTEPDMEAECLLRCGWLPPQGAN